MKKEIPIYFDSVIIASPAQPIVESKPELGRLKVGVFTKYGNRNGSYITDEIAEMLIASAIRGDTPVVGFYDPESEGWAGHTGPLLASAYGYVENFEGWQPFKDTDDVEREYAVFSVVLFNKYYKEANFIVGQHQSMELDRESIEGDWANIGDEEYFVYTKASIMGLCVIGNHEPCFSVSTFFSKNDENYKSQYEKFSSLLSGLKEQVEEAELNKKGGEQTMNEFENVETPVEETPVEETPAPAPEFEEAPAAEETPVEEVPAEEPAEEEAPAEETPAEEPVDFEALQAQIETLQNSNNELTTNYENAQARIAELEQALAEANTAAETANARIAELETSVAEYAAERAQVEEENKNNLIEKYAKVIDEEEISAIRTEVSNFSYSELEGKLAIMFANKQMAGSVQDVVPQPEPVVEDEFAVFMRKYRKN